MIHQKTINVNVKITFQWNDKKCYSAEDGATTAIGLAIEPNYHTIENGVQVVKVQTSEPDIETYQ